MNQQDQWRTDPERHRAQQRARNRAWWRAVKQLIAEHPDEYEALYEEQARAHGVTPVSRSVKAARIQRQIDELKARLGRVSGE